MLNASQKHPAGARFSISIRIMARRQAVTALCILALLCTCGRASSQDAMHIPATHGTTLAGTEVTLPDTLKSKVNIVVVGFSHASQEQIANWGRLIAADYGKSADVTYFELAMLAGAPKMLRGMIIKRMGSAIPFDERAHFVPVLEGEPAWRAVAHYNKADDAYVLLADDHGVVVWQTEGEPTNAGYSAFKLQVQKSLAHSDAP
jgi:hypothetical protein